MPPKITKQDPAEKRIKRIITILTQEYEPVCALHFETPFQLLIATILSAQCTDERVNQVTPVLFEQYPTPADLAEAPLEEIETIIRSTGFYRNKAKSVKAVSEAVANRFDNRLPEDMDALTELPGIGRKTANVVLGTAFGHPAIMVDTHVKRLSNRLGLTSQSNPDKIERDLVELVPAKERTAFSHRLIWHGRHVCTAKKPNCPACKLAALCPSEGTV